MSLLPVVPPQDQKINALLAATSPQEALGSPHQCRAGDEPVKSFVDLRHFPLEIQCHIGLFLHFEALIASRSVSSKWYATWNQPVVARYICRRRFPGLLEMHPELQDVSKLLFEAIKKYLRRHVRSKPAIKAECVRECHCPPMPVPPPIPAEPPDYSLNRFYQGARSLIDPIYWDQLRSLDKYGRKVNVRRSPIILTCCGGLVAWQTTYMCRGNIYIDDWHRLVHRRFSLRGIEANMLAMSSSLVVMLRNNWQTHEPILYLLNHQLCKVKKTTLPGWFERCYVQDDTVVVVVEGSVVVWSWGAKPFTIDNEALCKEDGEDGLVPTPEVIFHPQKSNVIFLVQLLRKVSQKPTKESESKTYTSEISTPECYTLQITKFEDGLPTSRLERKTSNRAIRQYCQRINRYGLHMLAFFDTGPDNIQFGEPRFFNQLRAGKWVAECFNVMDETFHQYEYELMVRDESTLQAERHDSSIEFHIMSVHFLDDKLILRYDVDGSSYQYFQTFQACRIDGEDLPPTMERGSEDIMRWSCGKTAFALGEEMAVLAGGDHYTAETSEASAGRPVPMDEDSWTYKSIDV